MSSCGSALSRVCSGGSAPVGPLAPGPPRVHVLYAVLALLAELGDDELAVVRAELAEREAAQQAQRGRSVDQADAARWRAAA